MRILAIDPGATRCGIAVIDYFIEPQLVHYEIIGLPRNEIAYQEYKVKLIEKFSENVERLLAFIPNIIVSEIVPVVGGGNFVAATQSQLASTAATTIMSIASYEHYQCDQISAIEVKKLITNKGKATKVTVRNRVLEIFPELKERKEEFKTVFDATDAMAIGLAYGIKNMGWKLDKE